MTREIDPDLGVVYHICTRDEWEAARLRGAYQPAVFPCEGFIHCSNASQVLTVANRFFRGGESLLLLRIDLALVAAPVRWEPADGELFPHIYGPLELASITPLPFQSDPDGVYRRF